MRTFLTTVAMIASVSAPAMAQVASADASKVEAGVYNIEPEHSRITFGVSHMGFTNYYGEFRNASGMLNLYSKNPDSS